MGSLDPQRHLTRRPRARDIVLTRRRATLLPDDAIVMHPGPMNRGVEIAAEVADLPRSVITRQVANGVAVRMAVLFLMLAANPKEVAALDG